MEGADNHNKQEWATAISHLVEEVSRGFDMFGFELNKSKCKTEYMDCSKHSLNDARKGVRMTEDYEYLGCPVRRSFSSTLKAVI